MENNLYPDNFTGHNASGPDANRDHQLLTAVSLIGDKVRNQEGEDLGSIHDIMLNIRTGRIEYYVVEFGGFWGLGEKWFAIPFSLLQVDAERKQFVLAEKRETLEKAPGFDKKHWPLTNDHRKQYVELAWSFWENPV